MFTGALTILVIAFLDVLSIGACCKTEEIVPEDCSKCGVSIPSTITPMIKGGEPIINSSTYPWMVALRDRKEFNDCCGALLSDFYILTAAHCVKNKAGQLDYQRKVHFQTSQVGQLSVGHQIEKIIVHPNYKLENSKDKPAIIFAHYDIALIKLQDKVRCTSYRNPICLPPSGFKLPIGATSIIAGWGETGGRAKNDALHHGRSKRLNFDKCIQVVPETREIKNHMLCTGNTKQTACYGDSGSPLIHKIGQKFYAVGVASSETDPYCPPRGPMIYTDVKKFLPWINENMKAPSGAFEGRRLKLKWKGRYGKK